MSEQGVPIDEVTAKDFIMVRAALVRRLGGAAEAVVWGRIYYRCDEDSRVAHDHEGMRWWAAPARTIADETGLTTKQARTAIDNLVERGFVLAEQHLLASNYDRTYSYRCVILPGNIDVPNRANESAQEGESGVPDRANAPSSETAEDVTTEVVVPADGAPTPEVVRLCELVGDLVRANGHPVGVIGKRWWAAADRMMRLDGYTADQVEILARWSTSDEFWAANIRSMPTLREKASTLRLQRNREIAKKKPTTIEHGRGVDEILRERAAAEQQAVSA